MEQRKAGLGYLDAKKREDFVIETNCHSEGFATPKWFAQYAIRARILCVRTGCGAIRAELGSLSPAYVPHHREHSPLAEGKRALRP